MEPDLQRGISPMVGPAASQPGGRGFDSRPAQVRFLIFVHIFWHLLDMSGIAWGVFWDAFGMVFGQFWGTLFGHISVEQKMFSESAGSNFPGCIDGKLSLPGLSPDEKKKEEKKDLFRGFSYIYKLPINRTAAVMLRGNFNQVCLHAVFQGQCLK